MKGFILAIFCLFTITIFAQETDSTGGKQKLQFNSPFSQEGHRMKFDLDLPGRKPIQFYVPKVFYAPSPPPFDPEVAWRRSIILPGWGQYYNRHAWKIPFVYTGYGAFGFLIYTSNTNYKDYQRAYRIRIQRDEQGLQITEADSLFMLEVSIYETSAPSNLKSRRIEFRSQRDRYILMVIGYHLIQTLEAYITAHLRDLDVSDDLSLRIEPGIIRGAYGMPGAGLGLTLRF
jgi:hypothetical protein